MCLEDFIKYQIETKGLIFKSKNYKKNEDLANEIENKFIDPIDLDFANK